MKFIGITGGVGAGKSKIIKYIKEKPRVKVLQADNIAHELMKPGTKCYDKIVEEIKGYDIVCDTGEFDRIKLAQIMFNDNAIREKINSIVHPAVKEYICNEYVKQLELGEIDLLFLECALLLEDNYNEICDELWYIYADNDVRRKRLIETRGYSNEKIDAIFASQLTENKFREYVQVIIDNNGDIEEAYRQVDKELYRSL